MSGNLPTNRRHQPGGMSPELIVALVVFAAAALAVGVINVAVRAGAWLAGKPAPQDAWVPTAIGVFTGRVAWVHPWADITAGAVIVVLAGAVFGVRRLVRAVRGRRSRVDAQARYLGTGADIEPITQAHALQVAARLGVTASPGIPIGLPISGGPMLYGSWEDMHLDIWGPRTGKTTARAIPAVMEAPGAVVATSNKRDLADATRDPRATKGPVWVFDPQGVCDEPPGWYWDPLTYAIDDVHAAKLAEHFAANSRKDDAKEDAYFDPEGQQLLADFILAGALARRDVTEVYRWIVNVATNEPVAILSSDGYGLAADRLDAAAHLADRQRDGLFGTARKMFQAVTFRSFQPWVCRQRDDLRPSFDPAAFVASGGTLYSLSKEGKGSAGALVTALTVAVVEAAEDLAKRSPGGRLATPMVGVLDEAANVCRWTDLPKMYSHFGSRGIPLMTFLQSFSQGIDTWGRSGMDLLFSAANVFCYGGGEREKAHLEDLAALIGSYDKATSTASYGDGRRSMTNQLSRERIFDVDELAAMPRGRAIVLASGARPTLIQTVPWMQRPYAKQIAASIAAHTPGAG